MCYKVVVISSEEVLENRFHAKLKGHLNVVYYHANGFANPMLPVIIMQSPNEIDLFSWGLIPSFAKDSAHAKQLRTGNLNARGDTIFEKVSFKNSILKRRCLVLADAFYETRDVDGLKYPYFIHRQDNQPFALAGIHNSWKNEEGIWHETFSIVTTEPNEMMRKIHNIKLRMPVILPPDKERNWLKPDLLKEEIEDLMVPLEDGILEAHTVNKRLNSTKEPSNDAQIIEVCEYPGVDALLN
jgi:putative SOS response-associated peptidase YedK